MRKVIYGLIIFVTLFLGINEVKADEMLECVYKYENVDVEQVIKVNVTRSNIVSAKSNGIDIRDVEIKYNDIVSNGMCLKKDLYMLSGKDVSIISSEKGPGSAYGVYQKIIFVRQNKEQSSTNTKTCKYVSNDIGCTQPTIIVADADKQSIISVTREGLSNIDYTAIQYYDIFNYDGTCKDKNTKDFALYVGIGPVGSKISPNKEDISSSKGYTNTCNYSAKTNVIVNDEPTDPNPGGYQVDHTNDVACGETNNIPSVIPQITNVFFNFVKILTPIMLIIKGLIDIFKAVTSAKEDEISKAKNKFFKRLVPAVIVFLIVLLAQVIFGIVGTKTEAGNISKCLNCFLNNNCEPNFQNYVPNDNSDNNPSNPNASNPSSIDWSKYMSKINTSLKYVGQCTTCNENKISGIVNVVNGRFYYIGSSQYNGQPISRGTAAKGLNIIFYNRLDRFFKAADEAGYTIWNKYEGWRSLTQQKYYYCCYKGIGSPIRGENGEQCNGAGTCNNGNNAAVPGTSNHGYGLAADLGFCNGKNNTSCKKDTAALNWAHNNAALYGLKFHESEDWHIIPFDMIDVTK